MSDASPKQKHSLSLSLRIRLSAMMFMQFMVMPVWFNTFVPYIKTLPGGPDWIVWCGMLMGFGMIVSPLLGMFADRFMNTEKVMAACNFTGAVILGACHFTSDPALLFFLLLAVTIVYMPTWSLVSALVMANSTPAAFPRIRVFGSIGWICSAVFSVVAIKFLGMENFDKSPWIFSTAAATSAAAGLLALAMPPTPPKGKGTPLHISDAFGLAAFKLFRNRDFFVFGTILALAMIPFQWYNAYNTMYLDESGFKYLSLTQNVGQMGELVLMLALPIIFKKCGYKWTMVMGIGTLALRYAFFLAGTTLHVPAFDVCGIVMQGAVFGMLIVGAQMYVNSVAPREMLNQAQGLVMMLSAGVGVFLSVNLFDAILKANVLEGGRHDWSVPFIVAFAIAAVLTLLMALFFKCTVKPAEQPPQ